jgi:hypothetical protein
MQDLPERVAPFIGHTPTLLFSVLLTCHVFAGMTSVASGAVAALSPKRRGRHPVVGRVYFWALAVVFVTSTGMSVLNWSEDAYLLVLGTLAFVCAILGLTARRQRWRGWTTAHIVGMGASYVVLLTAFYVDNGPRLPLWQELPTIAFWIGPTLIGAPIIARALSKHTRVRRDLHLLAQSLRGPAATPTEASESAR